MLLQMPIVPSWLCCYLQKVLWVQGNQCFRAGLETQMGREVQSGHLVQLGPGGGNRKNSRMLIVNMKNIKY